MKLLSNKNHRARRPRRSGLSLVEMMVGISVFAIGFSAVATNIASMNALQATDRETALAVEAAKSAVERLRGVPFDEAFATYNANPADDPDGAGTADGEAFAVLGLTPQENDPDGIVGRYIFPGDGVELREDSVDATVGMPRDLNADNVIDALDHAADHTLLPVRVRIEWTGRTGDRFIELTASIARF